MENSRGQQGREAVESRVVDGVHLASCVFGGLSVVVGITRARAMGNMEVSIVAGILVLFIAGMWPLRHRIPVTFRSSVILGALTLVSFFAVWTAGVYAVSSVLMPMVVVVAWLIWPPRRAMFLSSLVLVLFWSGAVKHILHPGTPLVDPMSIDGKPTFWLNMFAMYVLLGGLLLGVTRAMLRSVRASEREASQGRERLAGILGSVSETIFIRDSETGGALEIHGRFEEMYGYTKEELLRLSLDDLSAGGPRWRAESARENMKRCLAEGPQSLPWRARRKDGSLFWAEVSLRAIELDGRTRMLVTVRDVDQSMSASLELAELNADLEFRVRERTREIQREREALEAFSYSVSHDLRTPLRAIDGFSRIIRDDHGGSLPEDARRMLDKVVLGAGRMGRLIEALLALGRLDRHRLELVEIDIRQLVADVHEELHASTGCRHPGAEGCPTRWEIGDLPPVVADLDLVRQVFANLMSNACKFSSHVPAPVVRIGSEAEDDGIWYSVSDNGSCFDMAYAGKLFQPFQRLHGESVEGIGIGLATVKRIVERLGGAIEAGGDVGRGAVFRFRLSAPAPVGGPWPGNGDENGGCRLTPGARSEPRKE